jgi:hypothetical protein
VNRLIGYELGSCSHWNQCKQSPTRGSASCDVCDAGHAGSGASGLSATCSGVSSFPWSAITASGSTPAARSLCAVQWRSDDHLRRI